MTAGQFSPDGEAGAAARFWIGDAVHRWVSGVPDRAAVVDPDGAWTYAQLARAAVLAAQCLARAGLRPGDRAVLVGENCRGLVALILGLSNLGACAVPLGGRCGAREVEQRRRHSGARLVVHVAASSGRPPEGAPEPPAAWQRIEGLGRIAVSSPATDVAPEAVETASDGQVAALIYTAGTVAEPMGVVLTHHNLLTAARESAARLGLVEADRVYGALPLARAVQLTAAMLGSLLHGATLILTPGFDPPLARATLRRQRVTVLLASPVHLANLIAEADDAPLDVPALRLVSACGGRLGRDLMQAVERAFGVPLQHGYAATECAGLIAHTAPGSRPTDGGSAGAVLPGLQTRVVDAEGRAVRDGAVGELLLRGPAVMKGYHRASIETLAAIDGEGWLHTGDLVRVEDGAIQVVGRTGELIARFGVSVYAPEVEAVLNAHPAVARAAVIGHGETEDDAQVLAFVQTHPGAVVDEGELARHAAVRLPPDQRPARIIPLESLPATETGEIHRAELARLAQRLLGGER